MQHYFGTIVDGKAIIDGKQLHHLLNVRRTAVGEHIEVSDFSDAYLCVVSSLDPLEISVLNKIEVRRELDIEITMAFGLLKGDHNELIVLKGTELGISTFIPFVSHRCVVKPEGNEDKRLTRLRKKAEEGALQSRRDVIPAVTDYKTLDEVLSIKADFRILAYEDLSLCGDSLLTYLGKIPKHSHVLVVIGPEGGFEKEEVRLAMDYEFELVSLGRRILRAETAALYCASVLGAIAEG